METKNQKCRWCKKEMPANAINCPNCGKLRKDIDEIRKKKIQSQITSAGFLLLFFFSIILWLNTDAVFFDETKKYTYLIYTLLSLAGMVISSAFSYKYRKQYEKLMKKYNQE